MSKSGSSWSEQMQSLVSYASNIPGNKVKNVCRNETRMWQALDSRKMELEPKVWLGHEEVLIAFVIIYFLHLSFLASCAVCKVALVMSDSATLWTVACQASVSMRFILQLIRLNISCCLSVHCNSPLACLYLGGSFCLSALALHLYLPKLHSFDAPTMCYLLQ